MCEGWAQTQRYCFLSATTVTLAIKKVCIKYHFLLNPLLAYQLCTFTMLWGSAGGIQAGKTSWIGHQSPGAILKSSVVLNMNVFRQKLENLEKNNTDMVIIWKLYKERLSTKKPLSLCDL